MLTQLSVSESSPARPARSAINFPSSPCQSLQIKPSVCVVTVTLKMAACQDRLGTNVRKQNGTIDQGVFSHQSASVCSSTTRSRRCLGRTRSSRLIWSTIPLASVAETSTATALPTLLSGGVPLSVIVSSPSQTSAGPSDSQLAREAWQRQPAAREA